MISVAETLWNRLVTGFGKLPGEIMSALSHLASDLFGLGKNAILALVHGAESLIGDVENIGSDIGHALEGGFKDALSIFSPSKVMYRHGQMVAAGVIAGVDSMHGQLEAASMRMASGISGAVSAGQYRIGAAGGGGSAPADAADRMGRRPGRRRVRVVAAAQHPRPRRRPADHHQEGEVRVTGPLGPLPPRTRCATPRPWSPRSCGRTTRASA